MHLFRQIASFSIALAVAAVAAGPLSAQTGTVTGVVVDATTLRALDGAQVSTAETNIGSLSRNNGRFLIPGVPAGTQVLEIRYIGYAQQTQEITVVAGETVVVDFQLTPQAIALDEVVVTGTGVVTERRRLGQTVAIVGADAIETAPVSNVTEALSGRVAGMLPTVSGHMGTSGGIVLRGATSITQRNQPLVYIDGIRVDHTYSKTGSTRQRTSLDNLNPNDIERVEVIKGAAAATLYGTEASSGVIQIITKRGMVGAPVWSFGVGFEGASIPSDRVKESWGYRFDTKQLVDGGKPAMDYLGGWAPIQTYDASVRGGTERVQYFASGRLFDEGTTMYREFQGTRNGSLRTGLNVQATDRLGIRVDLNTIQTDTRQPGANDFSWGSGYLWGFWLGTPRNPADRFPYGGRYGVNAYEIGWPPPNGYSGFLSPDEHFLPLDTDPPVISVEAKQEALRVTLSGALTYDWVGASGPSLPWARTTSTRSTSSTPIRASALVTPKDCVTSVPPNAHRRRWTSRPPGRTRSTRT